MIVVTGGSGFIGSNLVRALVADGIEVAVVDDVEVGRNLAGVPLAQHLGQEVFRARLEADPVEALRGVEAVLHQGACSSTTESDEAFLQANNIDYSRRVLAACATARVPLVYASSASVYGASPDCRELPCNEDPRNGYARSKARFDQIVRAHLVADPPAPVVGLRYFNVYGPGERHKGPMASQVLQLADQVRATGVASIFGAGEGAGPGGHRRDFVHVDDVVAVVRWFLDHPRVSGIFNCGTGVDRSFQELAEAVVDLLGGQRVDHVPFPRSLRGRYQSFTRADLTHLRSVGCEHRFLDLAAGVERYLATLARIEAW